MHGGLLAVSLQHSRSTVQSGHVAPWFTFMSQLVFIKVSSIGWLYTTIFTIGWFNGLLISFDKRFASHPSRIIFYGYARLETVALFLSPRLWQCLALFSMIMKRWTMKLYRLRKKGWKPWELSLRGAFTARLEPVALFFLHVFALFFLHFFALLLWQCGAA